MLAIRYTGQFKRDYRAAKARGDDIARLDGVITMLANQQRLSPEYKAHPLKGDWKGYWECHVRNDLLLVWEVTDTEISLARVGTHSELFG